MHAFISHISEEAAEARALKTALEQALDGVQIFVSASDLHLGDPWLGEIQKALREARVLIALCSPASLRRPWLNFESGAGWGRRLPVVPVCIRGLRKDDLPDPLHIFQGLELRDALALTTLAERLCEVLGTTLRAGFDVDAAFAAQTVRRPLRGDEIGIVLTHGQDRWEDAGRTVFSLAAGPLTDLTGPWRIRPLGDAREFGSERLHRYAGLILGSPWRSRLDAETIGAIVEWVRAGGRLLLLGFELGDRHHGTNLAELAHRFGIDPATDIVGPPDFPAGGKPYEQAVDFEPALADAHPLTAGIASVRLSNVQTLRVEPGGSEWLRVGANSLHRPRRDSVRYRDGTMTTPGGTAFAPVPHAEPYAVAVEAPAGLCGAGGVHMIGTWDLLGRYSTPAVGNLALLAALLDWLSRRR